MLSAGTRVRQYQIIRELGRGGMGCVFLARDTRLGRRVAMKFLLNAQPDVAGRFLREARATARCNHENIVVIHEVDVHAGLPYMVLEYLEGSTLAKRTAGRPLGAGQAAELMVPVVRALARAHEDGIVHRDLKPENIFVTSTGTIKVLDFGIAKVFAGADEGGGGRDASGVDGALERLSLPAGTLPYMAPEQFVMDVDPRTHSADGIWIQIAVGPRDAFKRSGRRRRDMRLESRTSRQAERLLHVGFAVAPIVAGADKFANRLTDWEQYLAPAVARRSPLSARTLMRIVGGVEIAAGLLVALQPRIGGYVVAGWLGGIIGNLLLARRSYDVALRDLGLALGALALARLDARR